MKTIAGRYRIERKLGEGGFGSTWEALEVGSERRVAIKQLDVRRAKDWKSIELFEREAHVLRGLDHVAIPAYLDSFEEQAVDEEEGSCFYLVQAIAPGESLLHWITERGWRPNDEALYELARQLLDVLIYLHERHPPVVHRDIKPHNILRDSAARVSLVDFGSVKSTIDEDNGGGSTVVGTFGYMAPEQFRGHADPRTDLYGLGATLLYVMTHREPSEFPTRKLAIDVGAVLPDQDAALIRWLERLLEPDLEDRFASASAARDALDRIARGEAWGAPEDDDDELDPFELEAGDEEQEDDEEEELAPHVGTKPRMHEGDEGWHESMHNYAPNGKYIISAMMLATLAASFFVTGGWVVLLALLVPFFSLFLGVSLAPTEVGNHPASRARDSLASVIGCGVGGIAPLIHLFGVFFADPSPSFFVVGWGLLWSLMYWGVAWIFVPDYRSFKQQEELEEKLGAELPMHEQDATMRLSLDEFVPGERARISKHSINAIRGWLSTGALALLFGAATSWLGIDPAFELLPTASIAVGALAIPLALVFGFMRFLSRDEITITRDTIRTRGSVGEHVFNRQEIATFEVTTRKKDAAQQAGDEAAAEASTDAPAATDHVVSLTLHFLGGRPSATIYELEETSQKAAEIQARVLERVVESVWSDGSQQVVFDWASAARESGVALSSPQKQVFEEPAEQPVHAWE